MATDEAGVAAESDLERTDSPSDALVAAANDHDLLVIGETEPVFGTGSWGKPTSASQGGLQCRSWSSVGRSSSNVAAVELPSVTPW